MTGRTKTVAQARSVTLLKPALCSQPPDCPQGAQHGQDGPAKPLLSPSPGQIVTLQSGLDLTVRIKTSLVPGPTGYLSLIIEIAITTGHRPWRTIHQSDNLHSEFTKESISSELPAAALAKQILAHPPACAPPLNKLAGFPMPRSLGRLGDSRPVSSSPVAKELDDRRALLGHCLCGLVSCPSTSGGTSRLCKT